MDKVSTLRQPPVFYMACITSMLERFGFYVLSYLLVLYLKQALNVSDTDAFAVFAVFTALVYVTPAIGGYLADNYFGIRRSMVAGLIFEASGLTILVLHTHWALTAALASIIIGTGFFKTCPTNLMARAYEENDPRIDGGFTWYYMVMNFGSLSAPIVAGFIQHYYNWRAAFAAGAIVVWCSLGIYFLLRPLAKNRDAAVGRRPLKIKTIPVFAACLILAFFASAFLVKHLEIAQSFFVFAGFALLLYFIFEIFKSPKEEKLKIIACLMLIAVGFAFFIMYFQMFTSMTLYVDRCVKHVIFGFYIPTVVFQMLNAFWVIVLSPILAFTYAILNRKHHDLPVTMKFPLGLLFSTFCFFIIAASTLFVSPDLHVSAGWYIGGIASISFGELLISALGVAMVTRIAPKRLYGIMMGAWYLLSTAMASSVSGRIASLTSVPAHLLHNQHLLLSVYHTGFIKMGLIGVVATIIAFAIGPYIKRIANLA